MKLWVLLYCSIYSLAQPNIGCQVTWDMNSGTCNHVGPDIHPFNGDAGSGSSSRGGGGGSSGGDGSIGLAKVILQNKKKLSVHKKQVNQLYVFILN